MKLALSLAALLAAPTAAEFTNVSTIDVTVIAMGSSLVSSDDETAAFAGSNGGASGVFLTTDGGDSVTFTEHPEGPLIGMAMASDGDGAVVVAGLMGSVLLSTDAGATFTAPELPAAVFASQDAKYEHGAFTVTGQFRDQGIVDGMSFSTDGETWSFVEASGFLEPGLARYGSRPSDSVMYMTAGIWDTTSAVQPKARGSLSARLFVDRQGRLHRDSAKLTSGDDASWWGQVAKSEDGGATWSIVYETIGEGYYANDISCFDESTCTLVVEGLYSPKILTTTDGGATWTEFVDTSGGDSLLIARMVGASEAWTAGGGDVGRMWHSTDLAAWEASTTAITDAAAFLSFDIDNDSGVAFASGIMRNQLSCMLKLTV